MSLIIGQRMHGWERQWLAGLSKELGGGRQGECPKSELTIPVIIKKPVIRKPRRK